MDGTTLLRPWALARAHRVMRDLDHLPSPVHAERQFAPGDDPDRVLVFGNGVGSGYGVRSQQLALPGQLAWALASATGRGAEVDLARGRGMLVDSAAARMRDLQLGRYDAVVVTVGAADAGLLTPVQEWREGLTAALDEIRAGTAPSTPIVIVGIRPLQRSPFGTGWFEDVADRHASRFDDISAEVAGQQQHTAFVGLAPALAAVGADKYGSTESYRAIAEDVTAELAPRLQLLHRTGERDRIRAARSADQPEHRRQEAVDAMDILDRPATERLQRLVKSASDLFGTHGAALTVIDRDRQWHKASVGLGTDEMPRDLSICNRTIQQDGALMIGDATTDPATAGTDMQADGRAVRFYAGYPIESPDGYRLGALCVFDAEARPVEAADEERLRELALLVQNELWAEAGWAARV